MLNESLLLQYGATSECGWSRGPLAIEDSSEDTEYIVMDS